MKDAMVAAAGEVAGKKKVKVRTIKETGFVAGLAALENLESSDVATRPAALTARVMVYEGINTIVRLRAKNVPLLRIYTDLKKASGMRISFETFAGYVSDAAKRAGLKFEKVKTAPRMPASTGAGTAPVAVQVDHVEQGQEKSGWNCDSCLTDSQRHESTKRPGVYFWRCQKCGQAYADDSGTMTDEKL